MSSILLKQINLQKTSSDTYNASWDDDWTLGAALQGGSVSAVVHYAATVHLATSPALVAQNQPDILKLHIEFLRPCERCSSTITITPLKIGAATSIIQLQLSQQGQAKVFALATSTNFDKTLGPTAATA